MPVGQNINAPTRTPPKWAGDGLGPDTITQFPIKVEAGQFLFDDGCTVTLSANAAADATTIAFSALAKPIPSGTVLDFGGKKFARTTAAAAAGATSVAVSALPTALVSGDVATYNGVSGRKPIESGTLLGRTYTERTNNVGFGPASASDDEIYLLAFDIPDAVSDPYGSGYRHERAVYENFLPDWTTMGATLQGKVRELYQCQTGV
jgi:hypothetical protein